MFSHLKSIYKYFGILEAYNVTITDRTNGRTLNFPNSYKGDERKRIIVPSVVTH